MKAFHVAECVATVRHWYQWHPGIGECSVVMAIVSFFAAPEWERMGQKARRMVGGLLFVLLAVELYSIHRDGVERNEEQAFAECRMQKIADNIERVSSDTQKQYQDTIDKVGAVLDTAKNVQKLSTTNLLNITGGDAYGYVMPRYKLRRMGPFPGSSQFDNTFRVYNDFDQLLSGVTVKIALRKPGDSWATTSPIWYSIGSVGPHSSERVSYMPDPQYWLADSLTFRITIGAQNGVVLENLYLRPTKDGQRWEYRFDIIRSVTKIRPGHEYVKDSSGHLYRGDRGMYSELVKQQNWTERKDYQPSPIPTTLQ